VTIALEPSGRLDETPIGIAESVLVLDPITHEPFPVQLVDPRRLEVNPYHPPVLINEGGERYRAGREEMRTHGVRVPLVALTDGFLIDGHRRLAIALELGLTSVPVCYLSGPQARAMFATYSRRERRALERQPHSRLMLERIARMRP